MVSTKRPTGPIVVMAFQGWNDAADAATGAIDFLAEAFPTETVASMDDDRYFDFQLTRPNLVVSASGEREVAWPTITLEVCHLPKRDVMLLSGPEPNLHWRDFVAWLDQTIQALKPSMIVLLGAMLTDAPHSRAFEVSGLAPRALLSKLALEPNDYEGPIGIVGVLSHHFEHHGTAKLVNMWVSVPHYTAPPPNPKAELALLERLQVVLDVELNLARMRADVTQWVAHIDHLLEEDPDMADYVAELESQSDAETVPQGTGDTLAAAFERYLFDERDGDVKP